MTKPFEQYCPVAHALCLVGDRWSLLIVRELLHGPKRYTDLLQGLPGLGTNILAKRLRDLEEAGVVARSKLPPPAASTVYELTEYGRELDEAFYALARWGARSLAPPGPGDELYAGWSLNAAAALFLPEAARGLTETYALNVEGEVFTIAVDDGHMQASLGAAEDAAVMIELDMATFFRLNRGELPPRKALKQGLVRIDGDKTAFERCFKVLSLAPRTRAA